MSALRLNSSEPAALVRSCGSSGSATSVADAVIFALTFVCVHYAMGKPIAAILQARKLKESFGRFAMTSAGGGDLRTKPSAELAA
jgi:hypothetical protein